MQTMRLGIVLVLAVLVSACGSERLGTTSANRRQRPATIAPHAAARRPVSVGRAPGDGRLQLAAIRQALRAAVRRRKEVPMKTLLPERLRHLSTACGGTLVPGFGLIDLPAHPPGMPSVTLQPGVIFGVRLPHDRKPASKAQRAPSPARPPPAPAKERGSSYSIFAFTLLPGQGGAVPRMIVQQVPFMAASPTRLRLGFRELPKGHPLLSIRGANMILEEGHGSTRPTRITAVMLLRYRGGHFSYVLGYHEHMTGGDDTTSMVKAVRLTMVTVASPAVHLIIQTTKSTTRMSVPGMPPQTQQETSRTFYRLTRDLSGTKEVTGPALVKLLSLPSLRRYGAKGR